MPWWKQFSLILGVALLGAAVGAALNERPQPQTAESDPYAITSEAVRLLPTFIWVDARGADTFAEEHLESAINISLDNWDAGFFELIEVWEPGMTIVTYCDGETCSLSKEVAERLREELGDDQVFWLEGGISTWRGSDSK
ncbi:MAG: rhodanese-like domain-containing protein [Verrucomicrobiota bacterium]